MPVYRCNGCGYVSEVPTIPSDHKQTCGRCGHPSTVYSTVFFVEKLVERYAAALRELKALRAAEDDVAEGQSPSDTESVTTVESASTGNFSTAEQHKPLGDWFAARKIGIEFDHQLVDTAGYFDDAARMLGDQFELFGELIDRVAYAYRKGHSSIYLELGRLSQREAKAITQLCRELYSHTLFSRYYYQKPEKIVRLTLQTAPAVRKFFEGAWLEWYVLLQALDALEAAKLGQFACARGAKVKFPNEDVHELDVVVMPFGQDPICIECKSGEFRRDIEKYLRLRKRIGVDRHHFIICAADLSDEQASSLSAMYELTFVNLHLLPMHLKKML